MKKYKNNILSLILALILIVFIWKKFLLDGNTIIFVLIFIALYNFLKKVIKEENKRKFIISGIIGIMFGIIEIVCTSINTDYTLNNILNKWNILNFAGYTILAWSLISWIYTKIEEYKPELKNIKIKNIEILSTGKISFIINMMLILVSWLPYFLRYHPGLLTADSCTQISQAIGASALSSHHPIFHTALISIFVNIGRALFNNINTGVALYTIFQMIIMSMIFSIVLRYLAKKEVPVFLRVITLLYYMLYPINGLFSVTMWKDILFAGIVPIFIIQCIELVFNTENFLSKKKNIVIYIIVGVLTFLLRNNGIYIVILTIPFILIVQKKYWKKILLMFASILIINFVINNVIFPFLNIKKGSIAEMLSIPLQQIARVEKYHREELDKETIEQINRYFNCTNIGDNYNPIISDPVKSEFNNEYFNENKVDLIKIWLKLMKSYFKDYVESFISNSYGYYYPEATHWVANRIMEPNNMGLEQTPIIQINLVDFLIEKRDIPLISMFFSIGTAFWMIIICLGYKIYKKESKNILIYLPIFILWLTLIASPVFCEYRYAYPMFTTLPIYIGLNFIERKEILNGKNSSVNTML